MNAMPNKLRLKDGHLEMIDGSDVDDYLRFCSIPDGSDVILMKREHADQMARDAHAYRALMDARFALAA